jgi:hypothetical protein
MRSRLLGMQIAVAPITRDVAAEWQEESFACVQLRFHDTSIRSCTKAT